MKTISRELTRELIDFAPTEEARRAGFACSQLEGATAAFNMLARNRVAYLADEIGMGKTYVALGVMGLLRHFNPSARIVVIAPRENLQRKWVKELTNFVRLNWRRVGNRVKSIQGTPAWPPVLADRLTVFGHELALHADRDFFLRMPSFSLSVKKRKARVRLRGVMRELLPWLEGDLLRAKNPDRFLAAFGCAFNALVPPIDLLVIDEGHNLKHGFGPNESIRNRMLGYVFGAAPEEMVPEGLPDYGPRVRRLLLLSATPFEDDYAALQRQLGIFGFGDAALRDPAGKDPRSVRRLLDREAPLEERREIVGRFMLRRVSHLRIAGQRYTKNMYRREWRGGGLQMHDDPMHITDPRERLVVALVQKKVAEILQDERFNNHFQIGMLSSFESFLESVQTRQTRARQRARAESEEEDASEAHFDGSDQAKTEEERRGIDSAAIAVLLESHRQRFGAPLPHPKLDATARALESAFESGDKALVFVRRVATVGELAAKLDAACDAWLRARMEAALPELRSEIDTLFRRYEEERRLRPDEGGLPSSDEPEEGEADGDPEHPRAEEEDPGGAETFFAWFFRGEGRRGVLSGAGFQRNRLSAASSAYSTLFEDDHVAMLLGRPAEVLPALAGAVGSDEAALRARLRRRAYGHFRARSRQAEGYPRLLVYEAYQAAALEALAETEGPLAEPAQIVLLERYRELQGSEQEPPAGFPEPELGLGLATVFTELARRPALRAALWPEESGEDFRERFRRQEQRRELLSAMARLGAAYIDLYLLAVRRLGSFEPNRQTELEAPSRTLARDFLDLLERQQGEPGFHAFAELSQAAACFDLLLGANFPEVPGARLEELAALYGATLQRQVPVGRITGSMKSTRLVRQFRMPGFPLVLVTTDVLQEGEDLHTFCRRVVHYGISWTPSAMEQRTGRIDRIGSLVQRELDGREESPQPDAFLQVFYPHLRDTVEVLQVRRVLARLNRFLRLIHQAEGGAETRESRIDAARVMLGELEDPAPLEGELESAFPVRREWLEGELRDPPARGPDVEALLAHLDTLWKELLGRLAAHPAETGERRKRAATVRLRRRGIVRPGEPARRARHQRFELELRSQAAGDATLLRCTSPVGLFDLRDQAEVDALYEAQRTLGRIRIAMSSDTKRKQDHVTVVADLPFHAGTTRLAELERLVERTVLAADRLEDDLLGVDQDAPPDA